MKITDCVCPQMATGRVGSLGMCWNHPKSHLKEMSINLKTMGETTETALEE